LEEELRRSEEKHRNIIEQMQDAYYETDLAGNYLFVNNAAVRFQGIPYEKLIGMNYRKTVPEEDHQAVYDAFHRVYKTGIPNLGFAHKSFSSDGSIRYLEVAISLMKDKKDKTIGFRCVSRDVTERKIMEQILSNMANHDFLTSLPNRILLIDRFDLATAQANRKNYKLAIMSIDLDRFKEVNDTMGHAAGDEILKSVAAKLTGMVRSSDTVARLGGDEFLFLLPEIHDVEDATTIAEKVIESFDLPFNYCGHNLQLSTSIGIALYPDDGTDLETLMKKSDASMYYSKRNGGRRYKIFSAADQEEFSY
jgi:diguanylate cyclase (GGDEF)-like protein/PAS domain S-box-containing protein